MLVLSRKKGEGIVIKGQHGDIRIHLLESDKGKTRLGIEAPKGYLILREELFSEIKNANRLSAIRDLEGIRRAIGETPQQDQKSEFKKEGER